MSDLQVHSRLVDANTSFHAATRTLQAAAMTREVLSAAMGRGLGDADFAALIEVLEGQAGFRL